MGYQECGDKEGWDSSMPIENCTHPLYVPMSYTDTTYFMIVVMTTTGYGDQGNFIQSTSVMWFTVFFVIYGVAMVLTSFLIIAEAVEAKADVEA